MVFIDNMMKQIFMWGFWMFIPIIIEVTRALVSSVTVLIKYINKKKNVLHYYPLVSIIVPVYNSANTLAACLESIKNQSYPLESMEVFLIDNGSKDNSEEIYEKFKLNNMKLKSWWSTSKQGKSKALNKGIFASGGKYIINIDSDGFLDREAIENVVIKFENNKDIQGITGVVLIDTDLISKTKNKILKTMRKCEMIEYIEAFLIGRNFESTIDVMYTMAGAFSCFRREAIIKTQLYNSETLGEDTHMTFQIRKFVGGRIALCEDAFFYVDPIDNMDKLYTQRQRWQRSEIEVAKLFREYHLAGFKQLFANFTLKNIIVDHTLLFSKFLWMFAMIYLYIIDYPAIYLVVGNVLLFTIYILSSILNMIIASLYLKQQKITRSYVLRNVYLCILMPFYRMGTFFIRVAGIINSMQTEAKWKTQTLTEEIEVLKNILVGGK